MKKLLKKMISRSRIPDGMRVYAVGDIHGAAAQLDELIDLILRDARTAAAVRLIFLGDYVDRGPDSKGVLDRLINLQSEKADTVFLKGNHEAAMLDYLIDPADMKSWLDWGGDETLKSYGINAKLDDPGETIADQLRRALPPSHLDFLTNLRLTHLEGDYLFVHAGLRPGIGLDDQHEDDLLWIRKPFHEMPANERPEQVVVHGHHPIDRPADLGWRINVDTGACWSGCLSAVVLEGAKRRFLSTKP